MTRLRAVQRTTDGFELAELDIALRKEGRAAGPAPERPAAAAGRAPGRPPSPRACRCVARQQAEAPRRAGRSARWPATSAWSASSPAAGWRASARATCWTRTSSMADAGRVIGGSAGGLPAARRRGRAPGRSATGSSRRCSAASRPIPTEPLAGPFLDLFAGSGAAGIEALSRGAPAAVFVERDAGAARVIADNLRRTAPGGWSRGARRRAPLPRGRRARPAARRSRASCSTRPTPRPTCLEAALERLADPDRGWLAAARGRGRQAPLALDRPSRPWACLERDA